MHVLITGANGFVGARLADRLLHAGAEHPITRLTLLDTCIDRSSDDRHLRLIEGSLTDPAVLQRALDQPVDVVYHLASIAGGHAEREFELGLQVNLLATVSLVELLRRQQRAARMVYASTIAVYGAALPALVDDSTEKRPGLSYGAHKLCAEILIDDYSRRGWLDGRVVRLPGIVARAPASAGLLSAFMSDIFWAAARGTAFVCPVSPQATMWMMSVECCVDNLLHAAGLASDTLRARRDYTLPALRVTMGELAAALAHTFGRFDISYQPDAALEAAFGRLPMLDGRSAEAIGLRHDGSLPQLIARALPVLAASSSH